MDIEILRFRWGGIVLASECKINPFSKLWFAMNCRCKNQSVRQPLHLLQGGKQIGNKLMYDCKK